MFCSFFLPVLNSSPSTLSINVSLSAKKASEAQNQHQDIEKVVRDLFQKRDEILAQRKESAQEEGSENNDEDGSDLTYKPSESDNNINSSSEKNSEIEERNESENNGNDNRNEEDNEGNRQNEEEVNAADEDGGNVSKKKRNKVRVRQPISKSRLERKIARNAGQEYISCSGKLVSAKAPINL